MTAFAAALNVLFADRNLAVDALYRAGGAPPDLPVRVQRRSPEQISDFNGASFIVETLLIDVRVSQCPTVATGDRFVIAGEVLEVVGDPVQDADRLVWRTVCRAL